MPEASEQPAAYQVLSKMAAPYGGREHEITHHTYTVDQIVRGVQRARESAIAQHPTRADEIHIAFDVIYAPLLAPGTEVTDPRQKERSAQIQQALVHHLLYAATPKAEQSYAHNMLTVARTLSAISAALLREDDLRGTFWYGARAQAATINTLRRAGYTIIIPDYARANYQVRQWDVENGVDFAVAEPLSRRVFLVDTKSNVMLLDPLEAREAPRPVSRLPLSLQSVISTYGRRSITHVPKVTLTISADREYWVVPHDPRGTPLDYKSALGSYISLTQQAESAILSTFEG